MVNCVSRIKLKLIFYINILICIFLQMLWRFSVEMYIVALPLIVIQLDITKKLAHLSLSYFFFAMLISSIICSTLAAAYNKEKILLWNLFVFLIGTIIVIFSHSAIELISGRLMQGIGVGVFSIFGKTLIGELFIQNPSIEAKQQVEYILANIGIVTAWFPMLGLSLGGYLEEKYNWHTSFILQAIIAVVLIISLWIVMPYQKAKHESVKLNYQRIKILFLQPLKNIIFLQSAVALALLSGVIPAYYVLSTIIFTKIYNLTLTQVGLFSFYPVAGFVAGKFFSTYYERFFSSESILITGLFLALLNGTILFFIVIMSATSIDIIISSMAVYMLSLGFISPSINALAITLFPENSSISMTVLTIFIIFTSGVINLITSHIHADYEIALALTLLIIPLVSIIIYIVMQIRIQKSKWQ